MPVLRSKAEYCSRKMLEASSSITERLSRVQIPYIKKEYYDINFDMNDDNDNGIPTAHVPIEIEIPMHTRIALIEAKTQIDFILDNCKNDKGF
jgi:hypothetical protein